VGAKCAAWAQRSLDLTALAATSAFAMRRRPLGLAARAALLVSGLLAATGALATAAVMFGFERESQRHQHQMAAELAGHVARNAARWLAAGDLTETDGIAARIASRFGVRAVGVMDRNARTLVEHGKNHEGAFSAVAARVARTGREAYERASDGAIIVATPLVGEAGVMGSAVVELTPDAFRYNAFLALAPFFLFLAALILAALPLTAFAVRRALLPLEALTRFAERAAESDEAEPLQLNTGDEFETLANAFNQLIARLKASLRKIQEIAFVDPVTQLPNQDRFLRELEFYIAQARQRGVSGAVLAFEFERLAGILHTLNADAARDLTRAAAVRFAAAVRIMERMCAAGGEREQPFFAARLGVTSFALLAPDLALPQEAARIAQRLTAALNQPFTWRDHHIVLGAACGASLAPADGKDAQAAVRDARLALSAAHRAPARVKMFTASLDRDAVSRLTMEREMRAALARNEFEAFFQPKINFGSGRIAGAEALARWVRADRTITSPARFIPFAEETGLITALSEAILRQACWKAAAWARAGAPITMAVNVAAEQFRDERFATRIMHLLERSGLPPRLLELEITETVALEDIARTVRLIEPLRAAGVRFAIDDFGCGHSNLAALSKLPFDVIKIDQQFVRALGGADARAGAIIDMILALARSLDLEVVAEGVERREQAAFMASRGCQWGQGFLFGAAAPALEFAAFLERDGRRAAPPEWAA
jgi:EAL domain-containing protein (putative c-di-GMP-specific phosphodiesterase class I)/GGDEF domain-containing protein